MKSPNESKESLSGFYLCGKRENFFGVNLLVLLMDLRLGLEASQHEEPGQRRREKDQNHPQWAHLCVSGLRLIWIKELEQRREKEGLEAGFGSGVMGAAPSFLDF